MVHGRTRIKLVNPITRRIVKDYVNENTFQGSVISEGLRNLGYAKASLYNTPDTSNPPFTEIIGGILLLDSPIAENSQFVPRGVKMTGNGAYGITNSSAPSELGSYDDQASEILISQKKIKMVYNYSRLQANENDGKIACVCLTSKTGGYIGIGNTSGQYASTLWDLERNAAKADVCPQTSLQDIKSTYNKIVCNGCQYSFTLNGTDLEITKFKVPLKNASLLDCIPITITKNVSDKQYIWMGSNYIVSAYNNKIYLAPSGSVKTGNFYLWEYNTETNELVERTYNFGVPTTAVSVSQGKIFVPNNNGNTYEVFNMDGTPYDSFECGTLIPSIYMPGYGAVVGDFGNHTLVEHEDLGGTNFYMMMYDPQLKTAYPTNMNVYGYDRTQGVRQEETSKALTYTFYAGGASSRVTWAINNPLYLATINNLQTPVVKDITYEMIVEYTLTET